MATYTIVRRFFDDEIDPIVVATGLTLEEAKAHCRNPETSSRTATSSEAAERTAKFGTWFDGFEEE